MALEQRSDGSFLFICADCEATVAYKTSDFYEAIGRLRADGWHYERLQLGWDHWCPDCAEDE